MDDRTNPAPQRRKREMSISSVLFALCVAFAYPTCGRANLLNATDATKLDSIWNRIDNSQTEMLKAIDIIIKSSGDTNVVDCLNSFEDGADVILGYAQELDDLVTIASLMKHRDDEVIGNKYAYSGANATLRGVVTFTKYVQRRTATCPNSSLIQDTIRRIEADSADLAAFAVYIKGKVEPDVPSKYRK